MLNNISIKSRLIFVICFMSLLLIGGGVIGIVSLSFANDALKNDYEHRLVPMGELDYVVRLINQNQLAVAQALTDEPTAMIARLNQVDARIEEIGKRWDIYHSRILSAEEKELANKFIDSRQKFVAGGLKPAIAALRADNISEAASLMRGPLSQLFIPVQQNIDALMQFQMATAKNEFEKSQNIYQWIRNFCISAIGLGILFSAYMGVWLVRSISVPLQIAVRVARSVAAGDLAQVIEVRSQDETGQLMQALKDMNESLVTIVMKVRTGTENIATSSGQIASGNLDLSSRTEQQASALEETASSMEELTSTVKQNAENAHQANKLALSASEVAVKGGAVVAQVVDTMGSINDSSKKIVDIIGVIDSIAFQTNILALNAAVEAARAGEQGRGFAVVATEVRQLAQRSAAAAKEIKNLIADSVEKVDVGAKLVDQAGATMGEIVNSVKRVTDIMSEITTASREQTSGIEQVNEAITQMDESTQQNAALVEQASAAAESLKGQAFHLAEVVRVFKLSGTRAAAASINR